MSSKKNVLKTKVKAAVTAAATGMVTLATSVPVMATSQFGDGTRFSGYSGMDGSSIMNGMINLFAAVGTYGGGLYAIIAIFTLVLAIRNEDNEGRNKAVLNLLAAIILLAMGTVLNLFFVRTAS